MTTHFAYVLQNESNSSHFYFGNSSDLKIRILQHNSGQSRHTSNYGPWCVVCYGSFESQQKAKDFKVNLKSASGKAFLRKGYCSLHVAEPKFNFKMTLTSIRQKLALNTRVQ